MEGYLKFIIYVWITVIGYLVVMGIGEFYRLKMELYKKLIITLAALAILVGIVLCIIICNKDISPSVTIGYPTCDGVEVRHSSSGYRIVNSTWQ